MTYLPCGLARRARAPVTDRDQPPRQPQRIAAVASLDKPPTPTRQQKRAQQQQISRWQKVQQHNNIPTVSERKTKRDD